MPTSSWAIMRDEISRPLGFQDFATTTDVAGSSTDVISTELANRYSQADFFNGWYMILEIDSDGGTPANGLASVLRRVTNYVGSTGTLTLAGANLSTEDEAVDCALHRFHPDDIKRAFNRARQNAFPQIGLVRDLETLVTGPRQIAYTVPSTIRKIRSILLGARYESKSVAENLLLNPDFEDWTNVTTPANWTLVGASASVNQEEATSAAPNYAVLSGSNSARLVVPLNTVTTLLQTFDPSSVDYAAVATEGLEINASAWVYCLTSGRASVRIDTDVDAANDGTAHGGTGWELIKHTFNAGPTTATIAVGIVGSSGAAIAVFVDEINMVIGPSEILEKPYEPLFNWEYIPPVAGASNGGIIRFGEHLPSMRRIRIIGTDILSSVSADSDTIEIDGELLEPVYNLTRSYLAMEEYRRTRKETWKQDATDYFDEYLSTIQHVHMALPNPPINVPDLIL